MLTETPISAFKDTASKRFLSHVINNLAKHGHVKIEEIDKKDEQLGLVWNWLNAIARHNDVNKIITFLKRLNLYED